MAVLVNQAAHHGLAKKSWQKIRDEVFLRLPEDTIEITYDGNIDLKRLLPALIKKEGINAFIAAGGDGSVHYLLNGLFSQEEIPTESLYIGAIGLGSSNDFHKPFHDSLEGIPLCITYQKPLAADVGSVHFVDENGDQVTRYFIVNASLGVTAEANHFFNHGDRLHRFLKRRWTPLAITYAALRTMIHFRNFEAHLSFSGQDKSIRLSNLAVLKNPHFSGNMRYDQEIGKADGWLGLNYCEDMNRRQLIGTMSDLGKGRFQGKPKRHSEMIRSLFVEVSLPVALETDGEVIKGTQFEFQIHPKTINLLSNVY